MREPRVVVINDTATSDEVTDEMVNRYGIKALIDSELIIDEKTMGDLALHYHHPDKQFDDTDVRFMERLAAAATLALRNGSLVTSLE